MIRLVRKNIMTCRRWRIIVRVSEKIVLTCALRWSPVVRFSRLMRVAVKLMRFDLKWNKIAVRSVARRCTRRSSRWGRLAKVRIR